MTTEQKKIIELNLKAEELRDKRSKSFQAVNDLYSNGFISFTKANAIIKKIQNKFLKERLKIEWEKRS